MEAKRAGWNNGSPRLESNQSTGGCDLVPLSGGAHFGEANFSSPICCMAYELKDSLDIEPLEETPAKEDMARFMEEYHAKFEWHPLFLAAYSNAGDSTANNQSNTQSSTGTSSHQFSSPPFDWKVIDERLPRLDDLGKGLLYHDIVKGVCTAYDNITNQRDPLKSGFPATIRQLANSINEMSKLAANMSSASTRAIQSRMRSDPPLSKLRDCMSTLCDELAKYNIFNFHLDRDDRQRVKDNLEVVDGILKAKYTDRGFESGIAKLIHLL